MSSNVSLTSAPTASVVICTRNRPDLIGQAVASVLANDHPSFDVLVVDQSTDGRTGEIVRTLASANANLRYLHTSKAGLSRAYNIGIRETAGELLAFTDDDCVAPRCWLRSIADAFSSEPDGELMYGQVQVPAALAGRAAEVPTLDIPRPWRLNRGASFVLYGMGANFAARRRLFGHIGTFDEVLGGGGPLKSSQDFDLQYRAYVHGVTVLYRPDVTIDHYGVRSADQWSATNLAYGTGDGAFWAKHIRCGDTYALLLFGRHLSRTVGRELLHQLHFRRRANSRLDYLRGVFAGIIGSFAFHIDRGSRLYIHPQPSSVAPR